MDESEEQKKRNDAELKAWCEWKEICAILKCSPKAQEILSGRVWVAFNRKLYACTHGQRFLESSAEGRREAASWFDAGIIEKANFDKTKKNYKDDPWLKASKSPDPPLKVIRGNLIGAVGIINLIVEKWLGYNGYKESCGVWYQPNSLEGKVEEKSETAPDKSRVQIEDELRGGAFDSVDIWLDNGREEIVSCLKKAFNASDAAIQVAIANNLSITTDERLQAFTGIGKSMIARRRAQYANKLKAALPAWFLDELLQGGDCSVILYETMRGILEETPPGREFLAYVDECRQRDFEKRAKTEDPSRPLPGFEGKTSFYDNRGGKISK